MSLKICVVQVANCLITPALKVPCFRIVRGRINALVDQVDEIALLKVLVLWSLFRRVDLLVRAPHSQNHSEAVLDSEGMRNRWGGYVVKTLLQSLRDGSKLVQPVGICRLHLK